MERLFRYSHIRIKQANTSFLRYLHHRIDWQERLIGIVGARGVGKTTLILQHIKLYHKNRNEALYISLDDPYFQEYTLLDTAEQYVNMGGTHLYIDEVHKYPGWSREVKTIFDTFNNLNIVLSGSSILELYKGDADLSRRIVKYELSGLSFREYISLTEKTLVDPIKLEDILLDHVDISTEITMNISILKSFKNYLQFGYYPYFLDKKAHYFTKLINASNQIIESDLPQIENLNVESTRKIKKFLSLLGEIVPYQPNLTVLSKKIQVPRHTIYKYIDYLERARLINLVNKIGKGMKQLEKPDKIYLNNTNLAYGFANRTPNSGNLRETFFVNQLAIKHTINYGNTCDFIINDKINIEIGGKNKATAQIKNLPNSYIASDDIAIGFENKIPLWLFGFLY